MGSPEVEFVHHLAVVSLLRAQEGRQPLEQTAHAHVVPSAQVLRRRDRRQRRGAEIRALGIGYAESLGRAAVAKQAPLHVAESASSPDTRRLVSRDARLLRQEVGGAGVARQVVGGGSLRSGRRVVLVDVAPVSVLMPQQEGSACVGRLEQVRLRQLALTRIDVVRVGDGDEAAQITLGGVRGITPQIARQAPGQGFDTHTEAELGHG
ncbi:MAG: hypothetical protein GXP55_01275 [Deltaproteobacteria bacterium]|nr:hypothetical protein [Deltaproteobacteria bacterium]